MKHEADTPPAQATAAGQTIARKSAEGRPVPHVLVVDDDPQIRRLVSQYLGRFGYDVALAENGRDVWRCATWSGPLAGPRPFSTSPSTSIRS
jgi:PleD family two-component response regulator